MTKKPCFMTRLLAAVLAVVMLSSAIYIAVEADHDCSGEDCAICHQIGVCENLLKSLGLAGAAAAVIAARVLILSKSKSEIFITLLLSAVVSGVTVGGKACGKSLAMNSSTAVVRTAAKVLCFFRTLPQRIRKKRAEK